MYKNITIAVLIIIIFLLGFLSFNKKSNDEYKVAVYTKIIPGDSIVKWDTLRVPKHYQILSTPDTIKLPVDSIMKSEYIKMYEELNSQRMYKDTLKNDTSALIIVNSIIQSNELQELILGFQNKRAIVINTTINTTILNNKEWYIGGTVSKNFIAPSITYHYNKFLFNLGYEINNKVPIIGIFWKIY